MWTAICFEVDPSRAPGSLAMPGVVLHYPRNPGSVARNVEAEPESSDTRLQVTLVVRAPQAGLGLFFCYFSR